jgi:hypothetical protein
MYTAIKGIYENGQIVLQETPPTTKKSQVVVMFINEQESQPVENLHKGVRIGSLAGKGYNIPDDFNEPLDDLKEYM